MDLFDMRKEYDLEVASSYENFFEAVRESTIHCHETPTEEWVKRVDAALEENEDIVQAFFVDAHEVLQLFTEGEMKEEIARPRINNEIGTCSWNIGMLA